LSKITVFTLLIVLSLLVPFSASTQPTSITLKAGIVNYNFFPYHTRDADGQFSGVIVGYSNEIARLA